jgi:hypothetical protein
MAACRPSVASRELLTKGGLPAPPRRRQMLDNSRNRAPRFTDEVGRQPPSTRTKFRRWTGVRASMRYRGLTWESILNLPYETRHRSFIGTEGRLQAAHLSGQHSAPMPFRAVPILKPTALLGQHYLRFQKRICCEIRLKNEVGYVFHQSKTESGVGTRKMTLLAAKLTGEIRLHDAAAKPSITALTMMSADMNIPNGVRSRNRSAAATSGGAGECAALCSGSTPPRSSAVVSALGAAAAPAGEATAAAITGDGTCCGNG